MKKFLYPVLALGLLVTVSCEDDDNKEPAGEPLPKNAVSYNGKNYPIDNGAIIDWGSMDNHYNYDFFLTDGIMDFENEKAEGATVLVYAELWSPGTESFSTGTFKFDASGEVEGKQYFEVLDVIIDSNNNDKIDEEDDKLAVEAGTFKVSGSGNKYSIEVDVTLENNKALRGTYSGTFEKYEGTLDETAGRTQRVGKQGKYTFK